MNSFIFLMMLLIPPLFGSWQPVELPIIYFSQPDEEYQHLKEEVIHYLAHSWVSEEKVDLIMDLIATIKPNICVEIGTFTGSSALPISLALRYLNSGKAFLIDTWSNDEAVKFISVYDPNYQWWSTLDMLKIKHECLQTIHDWSLDESIELIHLSSREAAEKIEEIDFLHLDGNFSEEGSLLDVMQYLPKVNIGGFILLSNALLRVDENISKRSTIWFLYQNCELVLEIDNSNTMLFRKKFNS